MSTTTNVQQVKLNVMTQSQYNTTTKSPTELYMITDAQVDFNSLANKPVVDQTYSGTSTNAQSGVAVKSAIDTAISSTYKASGSVAFASLPTLSSSIKGNVYNVTDAFTTTADFVEGAGHSYPAGTNVVCINTTGSTYKWDVLAGFVDLSGYQTLLSATNKLNADYISDGTTNKTVTATEKSTWNGKQNSITGAASTITSSDLTASKALVSNSSGKVDVSTVTSTELGYVSGVTSAIQTQLNAKAADSDAVHKTGNETITGSKYFSSDSTHYYVQVRDSANDYSDTPESTYYRGIRFTDKSYDELGFVRSSQRTDGTNAYEMGIRGHDGNYNIMYLCRSSSGSNYLIIPPPTVDDTTSNQADTVGARNTKLSNYQPLLVSGTNIKTLNNTTLLGSGNISIEGLPSQTGNSGKYLTTNGTTASWGEIAEYTANEIETLWDSITPSS